MGRKERVFTKRKRRVYRKHISRLENIVGAFLLIALFCFGWWFFSKGEDYNSAERDISIEVMEKDAVIDTLYRTPLQRWSDPSNGTTAESQTPAPQLGPFPASILDGGWEASSRLQTFDEENLFEKINGAAPQYFQYGFKQLTFLSIRKPGLEQEINVELYDMGLFQHAIGIFAAQRDDDQELSELGAAHYFTTPAGALGVVGRYYFKLSGNSNSPELQAKAVQIVDALSKVDPTASEMPKIYRVFSQALDIPFFLITYEKSDVFQYDFAHDFWFARQRAGSDLRVYAHEADSAERAQELFAQLYENHLFDYTIVKQEEGRIVLKHNYLGTLLALCRSMNLVFGVEGAPDLEALNQSLASLEEALFDDEET